MKHLSDRLKPLVSLFTILALLQSCVVYHSNPITIEEIPAPIDGKVKVYTIDGYKYNADSIAIRNGNVECMMKTKVITIDTFSITRITIMETEPLDVNIISALHHDDITQIEANGQTYNFIKIWEQDDKIIGETSSKVNQMTVAIPIDEIDKIKIHYQ